MPSRKEHEKIQNFLKILNSSKKIVVTKQIERLDYSRQTFYKKFENLLDQKIIHNFTINANPNIFPVNLKYVLIEIKTNPKEPQLVKDLLEISQLKILDGILGEYSLFAVLIFKSPEEYYYVLKIIDKIMSQSDFKKYQIIEPIKVFKVNGIGLSDKEINPKFRIDEIDYLILKILTEEQELKPISTYEIKEIIKLKYNEIIKKLNMEDISQTTIHNRIKKLEKNGVILNYTVNFNPRKIGFAGKYLVRIKPKDPSKYDDLALKLEQNKRITDLFRIGEQYGLFAIIRVESVEEYAVFIRELYESEDIADTFTNFVLDELIPYTNFTIY